MKSFAKILLIIPCFMSMGTAASAQVITTEAIGPLSGSVTVNLPSGPCVSDTVVFTGSVHILTQVNLSGNTMDVHINLMSVKGTGSNGKYIANGAESFETLPLGPTNRVLFTANLYPPDPCRTGFTPKGALPVTVIFTLGTDGTLNQVSATVGAANTVSAARFREVNPALLLSHSLASLEKKYPLTRAS